MEILNIKLNSIAPVFISLLKLSDIKKSVRNLLQLTPDQNKNPKNYNLTDINNKNLTYVSIGDIKKRVRHSINFDRGDKGMSAKMFISIYGDKSIYSQNSSSSRIASIESSLDIIRIYADRYSEYQKHNLIVLFNSIHLDSVKSDPIKRKEWEDKVSKLVKNINKIHFLIAEVCIKKPYLNDDLETYYVNEYTPPAQSTSVDPEDISDFLLSLLSN